MLIYREDRIFIELVLGVLLLFVSGHLLNAHIITTRLGALEGVKKVARSGKIFHAYYGIPYAEPPIGRLRFEPPVETKPWTGVFNATETLIQCPQFSANVDTQFVGQEDCLFVNVFTPSDTKPGTNLPVLFFIFGGLFDHGNATEFGPDYIMSRDIILVMVSYRLGALGFLTTGDDVIPGNLGLRDQAMAMKWTRENIYDFGGDPRRITIQGHSAGSISVHAHTLSPLSRDYFDQAIMQSGFLGPNDFWDWNSALSFARDFGALVNCPTDSTVLLKECLQSKTAQELVHAAQKTYLWKNLETSRFRPVIEDDRVTNAFLNKSHFLGPYPTLSKPWLLGITTGEAALIVGEIKERVMVEVGVCDEWILNFCEYLEIRARHQKPERNTMNFFGVKVVRYLHPDSSSINMDPKILFPILGHFDSSSKMNYIDFIARWLKTRYFGEKDVRNTTDIADIALVKMLTGIHYGRGLIDVVQKYGGTKYLYLLDYRYAGGYTYSKGGFGGRYLGVAHADELPMIFKLNKAGITDEDYAFGEEIITRWVNFAHSGNPNVPFAVNTSVFGAWAPVSSSRIEFLRIDRHGDMEKDYFLEEYDVWRKIPIFSKYFAD